MSLETDYSCLKPDYSKEMLEAAQKLFGDSCEEESSSPEVEVENVPKVDGKWLNPALTNSKGDLYYSGDNRPSSRDYYGGSNYYVDRRY